MAPPPNYDLLTDIVTGLEHIQAVRGRPCLAYVGNVVKGHPLSGVDSTDDLPFAELVDRVAGEHRKVDLFLATLGGSAHQVGRFVNCLRARFDDVDVLIPSFCMSAGTLFALAANRIWMDERACLGPIDPQVPTKDGRFVPAQALLLLVDRLQREGQAALEKNQPVPWTAVRMIDNLDQKDFADAISASRYSIQMATQFLVNFKFHDWKERETSRLEVTPEYRSQRAADIAAALASHDKWKTHGHAISREVLWDEIKLRIDHPSADLQRSIRRLWAVFYYLFDKTPALKVLASSQYRYVRHRLGD